MAKEIKISHQSKRIFEEINKLFYNYWLVKEIA